MGRLSLHRESPADSLHHIARIVRQGSADARREDNGLTKNVGYPIVSRRTKDEDLPYILPREVKGHDGNEGRRLFIVVDTLVLDCTTYVRGHPGGATIIHGFGGQDCSWQWWTFHNRRVWNDVLLGLRVGRTEGAENLHQQPSRKFVGLRGHGYQEGDA